MQLRAARRGQPLNLASQSAWRSAAGPQEVDVDDRPTPAGREHVDADVVESAGSSWRPSARRVGTSPAHVRGGEDRVVQSRVVDGPILRGRRRRGRVRSPPSRRHDRLKARDAGGHVIQERITSTETASAGQALQRHSGRAIRRARAGIGRLRHGVGEQPSLCGPAPRGSTSTGHAAPARTSRDTLPRTILRLASRALEPMTSRSWPRRAIQASTAGRPGRRRRSDVPAELGDRRRELGLGPRPFALGLALRGADVVTLLCQQAVRLSAACSGFSTVIARTRLPAARAAPRRPPGPLAVPRRSIRGPDDRTPPWPLIAAGTIATGHAPSWMTRRPVVPSSFDAAHPCGSRRDDQFGLDLVDRMDQPVRPVAVVEHADVRSWSRHAPASRAIARSPRRGRRPSCA